jgi:hypothetical protein
MGARLDNPPFVNKMDPITPLDTTKTVCDGDRRPSLGCVVQCVLDYTFAIAVKCGGCFIKQENSRIT